jgi:hypothetical protein
MFNTLEAVGVLGLLALADHVEDRVDELGHTMILMLLAQKLNNPLY